MKTQLIIGGLLLLVGAACEPQSVPQPQAEPCAGQSYTNHPKNALYEKELLTYIQKNNAAGSIMLIKKRNEPLWIGAVGKSNLQHQTAMQLCTPFRTGSISKVFVATMAVKLVEEGKLTLEDKLSALLPEVVGKIPSAERITVRHMLAHTSGIFDPSNYDNRYKLDVINNHASRRNMTVDQLLERYVYGRPLMFEPGEQYTYSNTNYQLLGKIIERLTGNSLQVALDDMIVRPLGLKHTYIEKRDDRNVSRGYTDFYNSGKLQDVTHMDRADGDGLANGGLISTAEDLFTFSEALFGGKIVSKAFVDEMMKPQPIWKGTTEYGLGLDRWTSAAGYAYGHNGTLAGAESNWFYFPELGATFVLFKNNGNGSHKEFLDTLLTSD